MTRVVIIGAGPAGLGAAALLAQAGANVTVLERQPQAGGVPRLCGHSPFGWREFGRVMGGVAYAARLRAAARAAGAQVLVNHSVTEVDEGLRVTAATPEGPAQFAADRVLLATGAREASRAERLLPGERPLGIVTTGALQDLWFARGTVPFRRPVILGSELVSMSAVLTCRQAGAMPVAMVEQSANPIAPAPFRWLPKVLGLPLLTRTRIEDIIAQDGRLCRIMLRSEDGQTQGIDCDGLVLTGAFRPEAGLARLLGLTIDPATMGPVVDQAGRTSRPGIHAAGNLLRGVETAGHCWAEARAIARALLTEAPAAHPVAILPGAGISYVMPQRISPDSKAVLQTRLSAPARGTLTLTDATNRRIASLQVASAPERRVLLPLDQLALGGLSGPLTLAMEKD